MPAATKTKKVILDAGSPRGHKPPSRERPRPGAIMVELTPEDRAKLLAVQKAVTESSGMPVAISWTVRLAIRGMFDRLTPDQRDRFWRNGEKTAGRA